MQRPACITEPLSQTQSLNDALPVPAVTIPPGQGLHATPTLPEYVFSGQGSHTPANVTRVPRGHMHDRSPTDPGGDVDPLGHARHTLARLSRYDPPSHNPHTALPLLTPPLHSQSSADVLPSPFVWKLSGHGVHCCFAPLTSTV